jgi:hypothetical protein
MRSNSESVPHWRAPAVVGLICLALFCTGTVFLEYEMLLLSGAAFVVFAAACALAVISGALYYAPEGDERGDGLHLRQRNRAEAFSFGRLGRFSGAQDRCACIGRSNRTRPNRR